MTNDALPAASGEENGRVIALSTLLAGVAGGITVFLNGRRRKNDEREALETLLAARRRELDEVKAAVDEQRRHLTESLAKAKGRGQERLRHVNKPSLTAQDLADFDWSGLSRKARKGLERARKEAAKRAPDDLKDRREALKKSGEELARTALSVGERTAERVSKRLPEILESVQADVAPRAQQLSERAGAVAAQAAETSRETAEALRERFDGARPEIEEAVQKARQAAAKAPDAFARELERAEKALGTIASGVEERTSELAETVEARSRESAAAVKRGSKEGTSLLMWTGIAAGVVYFVFLNDEQRQKVRDVAVMLVREARQVYADIQGEDGEF